MSVKLDATLGETGTRFRIFPQPRFLSAFREPETITVSVSPHDIKPGPADERIVVIDAVNKLPYSKLFRPPYKEDRNKDVEPGPDGHFTHLDTNSREFSCATMYATVRRVLDIWEDYFKHSIYWHFEADYERLELIPLIEWDNAQSGYGFLEFGYGRRPNGAIDHSRPYCENFDVLAHELGHGIIFSEVGVPSSPMDPKIDYGGMHESGGDLVAIVSSLHFHSVIDHLLFSTKGNLFSINELDRVGELSDSREIRIAFNNLRMSDVGSEPHERSVPLTGGFFDVMVEVFQKKLVQKGLITQELADQSTQGAGPGRSQDLGGIQEAFNAAYPGSEIEFKDALLEARDYLGQLLAVTWGSLNPDFLSYHDILRAVLRADREISGSDGIKGQHQKTIRECFSWRGISPLPESMLLQSHTLKECGLLSRHSDGKGLEKALKNFIDVLSTGLNSNDDGTREKLLQRLLDALQAKDQPISDCHHKTVYLEGEGFSELMETPNKEDDDDATKELDELMHTHMSMEPSACKDNPFPWKNKPWRTGESLKVLLTQVNTRAPNRSKASDGTIGDTSHQSRTSDHNPWVFDKATNMGIVTAIDITHDPLAMCDCNMLARSLEASKDRRIKYVIWNKRIMNSSAINGAAAWSWRPYNGSNPHNKHIHISVKCAKESCDSVDSWEINVH